MALTDPPEYDRHGERIGLGPMLDIFIALTIIASVVVFALETLSNLSQRIRDLLNLLETLFIAVFSLEYLYRIIRARHKLKFITSFYGIIDLLAILPYFIAPGLDLVALRLLRFFRFLRILKLARYNRALKRFAQAFAIAKEEIVVFTAGTAILIFLSAVGIYHFEHTKQPETFATIFDCLWWAVATLTTVGYGDIYPQTVGGRVFTMIILLLGLGLVAATTGIISSALTRVRTIETESSERRY